MGPKWFAMTLFFFSPDFLFLLNDNNNVDDDVEPRCSFFHSVSFLRENAFYFLTVFFSLKAWVFLYCNNSRDFFTSFLFMVCMSFYLFLFFQKLLVECK